MKRVKNMAILLILVSASIATSIVPSHFFYSHIEKIELSSETEFNEIKEVEEAITSRAKSHKFKSFISQDHFSHNSPFSQLLVFNTRNVIPTDNPKYIQFCSFLN